MSAIVNTVNEYKLQYQETDQHNRLGKMDMLTFDAFGSDDGTSWWSGYLLSELFSYLVLKSPSDTFFKIENLRCIIGNPLTMDKCLNYKANNQRVPHHQKCWCDLIRQMIENGTGNTRFILRNMNGHGIAMNISCKISKSTYEHSTVEARLTNWKYLTTFINVQYSILPVDKDIITIKQIYYVDDKRKINITKSDHQFSELWFNSIEFTTKFLPEDFRLIHQNLSYKFIKYNCLIANDLDSKDLCEDPDRCWCDVINMLRSTGSAVTDIEMSPSSDSYNQHPAIVRFFIKVNPTNPDLLNIKIKFIFDETKYKFKQNMHFRRRHRGHNSFYYNNSGSDDEYNLENLYSDRTDDF
ncbi:MAG: hypothetical protein WD512_14675 [Candidatus Paceibacterota bacterium]